MDIQNTPAATMMQSSTVKPTPGTDQQNDTDNKNSNISTDSRSINQESTEENKKGEEGVIKSDTGKTKENLSPLQIALKKIKEQIQKVKEQIAETQQKLMNEKIKSGSNPSPKVMALQNKLEGLLQQHGTLISDHADLITKIQESNVNNLKGSLIDTSA